MIYNSPFNVEKYSPVILNKFQNDGVVVFGTGNFGSLAKSALEQKKININFFIDNNLNNWGKNFEGIEIISAKIF